jgi:hypothetical protein
VNGSCRLGHGEYEENLPPNDALASLASQAGWLTRVMARQNIFVSTSRLVDFARAKRGFHIAPAQSGWSALVYPLRKVDGAL